MQEGEEIEIRSTIRMGTQKPPEHRAIALAWRKIRRIIPALSYE
jgi:hypothetical protein